GYNPGGDHNPVSGDLNIKVSQSQMDLIMFGSDPLNQVLLASSQVGANQTNTNIGVNIDFNQFKVDPTLYFDTPLAAVSDNAIKKVVKDLGKSMGSLPWIGRVIKKIDDRTLLVNAGSLSGLQAGDEFEIYHVDHFWTGQPCQSAYLGSRREPAQPVATIKISQVGSITSVGLLNIPKQGIIKRGSEVVIKKLVGEKRNLKKKVRLGVISAKPIQLPGGVTFDLEPVINVQFINGVRQSSEFAF
ncbi:MAG: hypothetical protein IT289_03695, partial [Oligoflexia bacterium]|nr:hypothetical protein [Oligoflexia bacterium]